MLSVIDRIEDKFIGSSATVAPGGWCCWCWCCCLGLYADGDYPVDDGEPCPEYCEVYTQ
jgi:hypothetical protein